MKEGGSLPVCGRRTVDEMDYLMSFGTLDGMFNKWFQLVGWGE